MGEISFEHRDVGVARDVARCVADAGGRAFFVGGCVRDALLSLPLHDLDIEVYGIAPDELVSLLSDRWRLDLVGESFAVVKLHGTDIDVSLPRRERKVAAGHRGFVIDSDPTMPYADAASRRDLTINALMVDAANGELHDYFGGLDDLEARCARHVSHRFAEDALRVLRVAQFAARFELTVASETVALCRTIERDGLADERVWGEFAKLLRAGTRPSFGLAFLAASGWLRYFPELEALVGCPQDARWHPEGDAYVHTGLCLDEFATERAGDEREDLVVGLAVLCHDLGKPETTECRDDGTITAHGHEAAGIAPTRALLKRIGVPSTLHDEVTVLVEYHLRPSFLHHDNASDSAVRRLANTVERLDRLVRVAKADRNGRSPQPREDPYVAGEWLLERAAALDVVDSKPKPLVQGRDLISRLGLTPSPAFAPVLRACYEAQLDGAFIDTETGLEWARSHLEEQIVAARDRGEQR